MKMIVAFEYYKGDKFFYGKKVARSEFIRQIKEIEQIYDREEDNFAVLFCRRFGWTILTSQEEPKFIYDRDIGKVYLY